ncbi:MAG: hypothetical protein K0U68_02835 [Gammaproteobacteria bacterium]|nr:hypothetical protein [Gammaproteobacteria bacterium]
MATEANTINQTGSQTLLSIFTPCTKKQRQDNFVDYWTFSQNHAGKIYEQDRDLETKRNKREYFEANPVRSKIPLENPDAFFRNYVKLVDDPQTLDQKTLLMTCIYKFARHELNGIRGAWDTLPEVENATVLTDKISRVHLAEEFCHVRFFTEMLHTFHLENIDFPPLGPIETKVYEIFPHFPEAIMSPPAFVTELMGMNFYIQLDEKICEILEGEPEARDRLRDLLHEIMVDECAHIGQRRNFMGPIGVWFSKVMIKPIFKMFTRDIPEIAILFDVNRLVRDAHAFNYSTISRKILDRSWVPSYCQP